VNITAKELVRMMLQQLQWLRFIARHTR